MVNCPDCQNPYRGHLACPHCGAPRAQASLMVRDRPWYGAQRSVDLEIHGFPVGAWRDFRCRFEAHDLHVELTDSPQLDHAGVAHARFTIRPSEAMLAQGGDAAIIVWVTAEDPDQAQDHFRASVSVLVPRRDMAAHEVQAMVFGPRLKLKVGTTNSITRGMKLDGVGELEITSQDSVQEFADDLSAPRQTASFDRSWPLVRHFPGAQESVPAAPGTAGASRRTSSPAGGGTGAAAGSTLAAHQLTLARRCNGGRIKRGEELVLLPSDAGEHGFFVARHPLQGRTFDLEEASRVRAELRLQGDTERLPNAAEAHVIRQVMALDAPTRQRMQVPAETAFWYTDAGGQVVLDSAGAAGATGAAGGRGRIFLVEDI